MFMYNQTIYFNMTKSMTLEASHNQVANCTRSYIKKASAQKSLLDKG